MAERETWIILGATSSIARPFARLAAADGADLLLAGRDLGDMERDAADLAVRYGAEARVMRFDVRNPADRLALAEAAAARPGTLNAAVFLGAMPEQAEVDADPDLAAGVIANNLGGVVAALQRLAPIIEGRGAGVVVGVGSVAGDRGRAKHYVYGASKAGFHAYLSGLRGRMARKGVHVMTVKPGFVDTAMTWGHASRPLPASPDAVAADIFRAAKRRKDVLYTPWFWRWIMRVVQLIPERVFKRLSF